MARTRRRLLASIGAGATVFAGCASGGRDSPTSESTPAQSDIDVSAQARSCATTDAGYVVRATPRGVTMAVDSRSRGEAIREEVLRNLHVGDPPDVRILSIDGSGGARYVVEFGPFSWSAEYFAERYGRDPGVGTIRNGRSLATVRTVSRELRGGLLELDGVGESQVSVRIVRPDPPAPMSAEATISGGEEISRLESAQSYSLRFRTPKEELPIAAPSDLTLTGTLAEPTPGVRMNTSRSAVENLTRIVTDLGPTRVAGNTRYSVQFYFDGDVIWEGPLSHQLVTSITRGEWGGQIVVSVENQTRLNELLASLGVVSFSVPTSTDIERCG